MHQLSQDDICEYKLHIPFHISGDSRRFSAMLHAVENLALIIAKFTRAELDMNAFSRLNDVNGTHKRG